MFGYRRVGPGDQLAPAGELRAGAPDLLAVDDPLPSRPPFALHSFCPGRQARQVRAGARFGEQLAAQLLGPQEPAHEPRSLTGGAEQGDGRRDQGGGHRERLVSLRRGEAGFRLAEGPFVRVAEPGSAVFGGPGDGSVAGVELFPLPGHGPVEQRPLLLMRQPVEHRHVVAALAPRALLRVGRGGRQPRREPVPGRGGELRDARRGGRRHCVIRHWVTLYPGHGRAPSVTPSSAAAAASRSHRPGPGGHSSCAQKTTWLKPASA